MAYFPSSSANGSARRRNAVRRVRVANLGDTQYIDPNKLSVKSLAVKAINSLIGIFDPGKKREASRKARAVFYGDLAVAGSITAARIVNGGAAGGQYQQYTTDEKAYYADQLARLKAADPTLQARALTAGELPVPGDGDSPAGWQPSSETVETFQREIDAYKSPSDFDVGGGKLPPQIKQASAAGGSLLLPLVAIGLILGRKLFK